MLSDHATDLCLLLAVSLAMALSGLWGLMTPRRKTRGPRR